MGGANTAEGPAMCSLDTRSTNRLRASHWMLVWTFWQVPYCPDKPPSSCNCLTGYSEFTPYSDSYAGRAGEINYEYQTETPLVETVAEYSYTPAAPVYSEPYIPVEPEV